MEVVKSCPSSFVTASPIQSNYQIQRSPKINSYQGFSCICACASISVTYADSPCAFEDPYCALPTPPTYFSSTFLLYRLVYHSAKPPKMTTSATAPPTAPPITAGLTEDGEWFESFEFALLGLLDNRLENSVSLDTENIKGRLAKKLPAESRSF